MDIREEKTEWGVCYYYNGEHYEFALYYYDDDPKTAYLANVETDPEYRGNGLGNLILRRAELYAKRHKANVIYLKCLRSSWVCDWYKRHGYKYHSIDKDKKYTWLKKPI